MKSNLLFLIDFEKVNKLLEGFNKTTGFVTAILDLEGNVLSKSGWRQMCTHFHRVHPETAQKCTNSDTELANKMAEGEKYHFYKCLNGLIDVAVPIIIKGEHVANLFSGQFFFEKPDIGFFKQQAQRYGFDESKYLDALDKVPVVSEQEVITAMNFLLDMTQMISDLAYQKFEQEYNQQLIVDMGNRAKALLETIPDLIFVFNQEGYIIDYHTPDDTLLFMPPNDFINKHISTILPGNTAHITLDAIQNLFASNKPQTYQYTAQTKGRTRFYDARMVKYGNDKAYVIVRDITAQRDSENKLQDAQANLRAIVENTFDSIWSINTQYEIVYINKAFANAFIAAFGVQLEPGINILKAVPKKMRTEWKKIYDHVLSGERFDFVDSIEANGTVIHIEVAANPIKHGNKIIGASLFGRNITDKKAAENALRDSEARLYSIFRSAPVGIGLVTNRVIQKVNHRFCQMTGYSEEEVMGRSARMLYPTDDEYNYVGNIKYEQIRLSGTGTVETKWKRKDGVIIYVLISSTPIDGNDINKGVTFSALDITINKKAQQALAESEEKYRDLIKNSGEGIGIVDTNECFTFINPAGARMFGVGEQDMIGRSLFDFCNIESRMAILDLTKRRSIGVSDNYELEITRPDGNKRNLIVTATPQFDKNNMFSGTFGIFYDNS
jgi:PAS domain S-box-containing protein